MTGRNLNQRRSLEHGDQMAQLEAVASDPPIEVVPSKKKTKGKAAVASKTKKPRKAKAPPRLRARWGLFDAGMKQVAIFDYRERAGADEKLAELLAKKKGLYFVQMVKDSMPEPAPAEAALVE